MKKALAILFALCLTLSLAFAEETAKTEMGSVSLNGVFRLQGIVPEGYTFQIFTKDNEGLLAAVTSEDTSKPTMILAIEFEEQYYDVDRMNDMTEEQLAELASTFSDEGEEVTVSYLETAYGTKLMFVRPVGDVIPYASILTVYKGYEIEFDLVPGRDMTLSMQGLTEEQIQIAVQFLSDLDFIAEE